MAMVKEYLSFRDICQYIYDEIIYLGLTSK